MLKRFVLALLLAIAGPLSAAELRVIDGDTVVIDGVKIRIERIDTPETWRARCAAELALGQKAKARLSELLAGRDISYEGKKLDRWGRTLGTVYADGEDVGEILIAEGLAVRWRRGPKAKAERMAKWCPSG
jgi:micrococcal nuclease